MAERESSIAAVSHMCVSSFAPLNGPKAESQFPYAHTVLWCSSRQRHSSSRLCFSPPQLNRACIHVFPKGLRDQTHSC